MANPTSPSERPLSPHLFIYSPMLTMMMSILHRITGIALYVGTLLLVWFLVALSSDAGAYGLVTSVIASLPGQLVMFGFSWALFHHMMGGIRHAMWDAGYGLDHPQREWLAQGTWIGGLALTVLVWVYSFFMR